MEYIDELSLLIRENLDDNDYSIKSIGGNNNSVSYEIEIENDIYTIDIKKKDYATLSSIKKNNPKLYNAYIEREKAND